MILKTDQNDPEQEHIRMGAEIINRGGVVVFPTETVYGMGANAFSEEACRKIFLAKKRPADNPLIVHISSFSMISTFTTGISDQLVRKLSMVWPGPVTVLLPRNEKIPDVVTGGSRLVAVRMPANNLALKLIDAAGVPIAAPSANISTRPSITDSAHAIEELEGRVDLIYDSGPTPHGIESTIIDISGEKPVLLRAGSKPIEDLKEIFGEIDISDYVKGYHEGTVPLVPGMKYRHYSPNVDLYLARDRSLLVEISGNYRLEGKIALIASSEICSRSSIRCIDLGSEDNLDSVAYYIFSALRELEKLKVKAGVIMPFPEHGKGLAIMNRIRKASTLEISTSEELEKLIL